MTNTTIEQTMVKLEIKHCGSQYYAMLSLNQKILGISERVNSDEAAKMAGHLLLKRYEKNMQASLHV